LLVELFETQISSHVTKKLFNSVIGKTGKVYSALLGQLAVQGAEMNVLGYSEMCIADILLQSVCRLICNDLFLCLGLEVIS
jgi:hypothetical protein